MPLDQHRCHEAGQATARLADDAAAQVSAIAALTRQVMLHNDHKLVWRQQAADDLRRDAAKVEGAGAVGISGHRLEAHGSHPAAQAALTALPAAGSGGGGQPQPQRNAWARPVAQLGHESRAAHSAHAHLCRLEPLPHIQVGGRLVNHVHIRCGQARAQGATSVRRLEERMRGKGVQDGR